MNRTSARLLALPVALALAATLSGCGTGFLAATNRPYVPSNGTSMTVGTMDARNLLLVDDDAQPGTFKLIGALVNNGADPEVLTAVAVQNAGAVPLTPITVPGRSIITTGGTPTSTILDPGRDLQGRRLHADHADLPERGLGDGVAAGPDRRRRRLRRLRSPHPPRPPASPPARASPTLVIKQLWPLVAVCRPGP